MSTRFAFLLVLSLACLIAGPVRAELSLGQLRTKFESAVEEEKSEYAEKLLKLREGYGGALARLKVTLGREERLEEAVQVLNDLESIEGELELEEISEEADYRHKSLRSKIEREKEKLDLGHQSKIVSLANIYLVALDKRKRALTRAGSIKEALVVEQEAQRVRDVPEFQKFLGGQGDDEEGSELTVEEMAKLLVGTKWSYQRPDDRGKDVIMDLAFVSKTEALFGASYKVTWEALPDRQVRMTRPDFDQPAVIQFDEKLKTFKGKTSKGKPARGKRSGPLADAE